MRYTTTFHNGSKANRAHNKREESVLKQKHIDKDGEHETWKDEAPKDAYERLFGEAVKEFNAKQRNKDRQIKDYYKKIESTNDKHSAKPVYEVIVSIGNVKEQPEEDTSKEILKAFVEGWSERNPNLEMIGAYYHNDEEGVPHVHIDYIPVAHKEKGLKVKNSLSGALQEMGYEDGGRKSTRQMQWECSENKRLKEICKEYGVETKEAAHEKREHYSKEEYVAIERKKDLEELNNQLKSKLKDEQKTYDAVQQNIENSQKVLDYYDKAIENRQKKLEELNGEGRKIAEKCKRFESLRQATAEKFNEMLQTYGAFDDSEETQKMRNLFKTASEVNDEVESGLGKISKQLKPKEHDTEAEIFS